MQDLKPYVLWTVKGVEIDDMCRSCKQDDGWYIDYGLTQIQKKKAISNEFWNKIKWIK